MLGLGLGLGLGIGLRLAGLGLELRLGLGLELGGLGRASGLVSVRVGPAQQHAPHNVSGGDPFGTWDRLHNHYAQKSDIQV